MTVSLESKQMESSEEERTSSYRTLGLWNGIAVGLGVALGVWGIQVVRISQIPTVMPYQSMIAAGLLVILICAVAGWLSAVIGRTVLTMLVWLAAAVGVAYIISIESNQIRSVIVWLADSRFWGRMVFQDISFESPLLTLISQVLSGFFLLLTLTVLGLLQDYRLEGLEGSLSDRKRLTSGTLGRLLLPLPFVALAGFITTNMIGAGGPSRAFQEVHEVIQTGRDYEGDLFELTLDKGLNYNAIRGVRDELDGEYTLSFGGFDPAAAMTIIVADFDNGAWINCRSLNDQLNFCGDASPPYTIGLKSLITGEPVPDDCFGCMPEVEESLAAWLPAQAARLGDSPQISRLAQRGSHVLMQAESTSGDYAIECWFTGNIPVNLESCQEAGE